MDICMPALLGIGNTQTDFRKRVNNYWDSLAVNIPENGKIMEIGFDYNITRSSTIKAISELKDDKGESIKFKDNKHLANYIDAHIDEEFKHLYGVPINHADYLLWVYCLEYGDVANNITLRNKSDNIRFYIHNETEVKKIETAKFMLKKKAIKIYSEIIEDIEKVDKYLYALGYGSTIAITDDLDKFKLLEKEFNDHPEKIIEVSKDKQLDSRVFVEACIANGILRKLENSSVIVNSSDNKPIGGNMQDAMAFLALTDNVKIKNELEGRLNALPKA